MARPHGIIFQWVGFGGEGGSGGFDEFTEFGFEVAVEDGDDRAVDRNARLDDGAGQFGERVGARLASRSQFGEFDCERVGEGLNDFGFPVETKAGEHGEAGPAIAGFAVKDVGSEKTGCRCRNPRTSVF